MTVKGRFAPTPSGRMHLGNLLSALLAWLDVRSVGGELVLRIEDLDTQRTSPDLALQLMDDLRWLGLDWDEGGLEPEYMQSRRTACYEEAFRVLDGKGLVYPCYCSRTERMAASAPHRDDGAVVYSGKCFRLTELERAELERQGRRPAWRVRCPELTVALEDGNCGPYAENLARDCGDFIVRRSDGVFAYQLAVVVDDALMGVNHVVRGRDLLCSAPGRRGSMRCWDTGRRGFSTRRCCLPRTGGGWPSGTGIWIWGRCGGGIPRRNSPGCWPVTRACWTGRKK